MNRRVVNSADAPEAAGGYAQAIEITGASRVFYVSGQIPEGRDGQLPRAFGDQCRQAWANVEAQLRAAEMSLDNLVKVTIYLSDRQYAAENRDVRQEILGNRTLALTVIITGIFDPRWLVEIAAIAAWKGERTLDLTTLLLFLAAATVIAITPGSGIHVAARTLAGGRRESLASSVGLGLAPAKCFTTDPVCNRARNHPETGRVHRIPSTDEDVLCSPPPSRSARPFRSPASRSSQVLRFWSRRAHFSSAEFHVGLAGSLDTGKAEQESRNHAIVDCWSQLRRDHRLLGAAAVARLSGANFLQPERLCPSRARRL